jgi:type VI secretion system protein ImpL
LLGPQGSPGAYIEAQFKPFHQVVEGSGSSRLIDVILGDLTQINNTLQTIVLNPAQEQQATSALRGQVAQFKNDALRMPRPFSKMLLDSADSFEGAVAAATYGQIRDEFQNAVYGPCQKIVPNRYPFNRNARDEIPLQEFGKLFGGNGYFDNFFKKNLENYADTSQREWKWRADNPVARQMDVETLRQFQRAAQIKDAFFPNNGNVPFVTLFVTPPAFPGTGLVAKLEINGIAVTSSDQPNPAAMQVQWPGGGGKSKVSLTQGSTLLGELEPSLGGQWALFRLLDRASKAHRPPNGISASWSLNLHDVSFQFAVGTSSNPLLLPALAEFRCPAKL